MVAVAYMPETAGVPDLYLLPPAAPSPQRRAVYRRRRLGAAIVLASLVLAGRWVLAGPGSSPLAPEPARAQAPAAAPEAVHIVQPGETWWSIARRLQPTGDVRPLIERLSASHGPGPLVAGERIVLAR